MSIFQGLNDLLKQTSDFVGDAMGSYNTIKDTIKPPKQKTVVTQPAPAQNPTYSPNITLGDFKFTPDYKLLFGGGALLLVALYFMKR